MGSKVEPYFILTAEKVTNPKEIEKLNAENLKSRLTADSSPPITPAPSGVSGNTARTDAFGQRFKKKKKRVVKYKIPVKEIRQKDSLNKRMEMIKEKLEKSRERFYSQKNRQGGVDLKCEASGFSSDDEGTNTFKLDRSVSDMGPNSLAKRNETFAGSNPYVYFVVSEERLKDPSVVTESGERIMSKSADKRRRVRIVEENRLKRDKKEKQSPSEKIRTLAREIGLKSEPVSKSTEGSPERKLQTQPAMNTITFPGPDYEPVRPQTQGHPKSTRIIHSPVRNPPCTPANTMITSDFRIDQVIDVDDTVPRKPFLSSPMYTGKIKGIHSLSLNNFELPNISADQRRRALGFAMSNRFEDFAYPSSKPTTSERARKVSFADPLPVIRGSGFVLSTGERDNHATELPMLGPRAATMGSITLPSENPDKQTMCQKYLAGENASATRTRKFGVPLPLPKIDIVSNVYDEMIIKMIQEYLQDSNTPSRQSQLARELLVHLQKHNEHMKELNVPNLDKNKVKPNKAELLKHQKKAQKLQNELMFPAPPNTAEDKEPKVMTPLAKDRNNPEPEPALDQAEQPQKADMQQKTVPFVQITFKNRKDDVNGNDSPNCDTPTMLDKPPRTSESGRRYTERPILSAVTPVSFQMVPPGLSKDDSFSAVPLKT